MSNCNYTTSLPWWLSSKEFTGNTGDVGLIPGSERSPGEGNDNPLQYSCLGNPMDKGAWQAMVHGVAKSWTWLSDSTTTDAMLTAENSEGPDCQPYLYLHERFLWRSFQMNLRHVRHHGHEFASKCLIFQNRWWRFKIQHSNFNKTKI